MPGKVTLLPSTIGSLAGGLPPAPSGTLFVLGTGVGVSVEPDAGFQVVFGRNGPDVHVCVGADDPHVSRRQGVIAREHDRWTLHNLGKPPIRFPGQRLVLRGSSAELPVAYMPLFVVTPKHEHLLEVRVAAGTTGTAAPDAARAEAETRSRIAWQLAPVERLVLTCLAQRYLRHEPHPQPLAWAQVAAELSDLRPGESWTWRRAAHIVTNVRKRLSATVSGLREEEIPPPVGNALNHNLIMELLVTTSLTTADLALLGE